MRGYRLSHRLATTALAIAFVAFGTTSCDEPTRIVPIGEDEETGGARCRFDKERLEFGRVLVGDSVLDTVVVTNIGTSTLRAEPQIVTTARGGAYSIESGGEPFALRPRDQHTIVVRFTPSQSAPSGCLLRLSTGCEIGGSGESDFPAVCSVEPSSINFGPTVVGTEATRTLIFRNAGGDTLRGDVSLPGCADMSIDSGAGPFELAAAESIEVVVRYAPSTDGPLTCTLEAGTACGDVEIAAQGEPPAECSPSTPEIDFGLVAQGDVVDRFVSFTNTGGDTLSGVVALAGGCDPRFSIVSGAGSFSLTAGQSRDVTVRFAPDSQGDAQCVLDLGTATCAPLPILGEGDELPACSVVPATIDHGQIPIGGAGDEIVTIRNVGGGRLEGDVSVTCDDCLSGDEISIVSGGGPFSLERDEERSVTVRFAPQTATGLRSGTVRFGSGSGCTSVPVQAEAIEPAMCSVSPPSLAFGLVETGSSQSQTVRVTNSGQASLEIDASLACGAPYSLTGSSGLITIPGGSFVDIEVTYAPTTPGSFNCELDLGTGECPSVPISGSADDPPSCQITHVTGPNLGTVVIGSPETAEFTLENTGGFTVSGTVSLSGCSGEFSITQGGGSYSLSSGQSRTVRVRLAPTSTGAKSCTVLTGSQCANVVVSGTAIDPALCSVSTTFINFGDVGVGGDALVGCGNSRNVNFTVTNVGDVTGTFSVTESSSQISLLNGGTFALGPNAQRTVTVRYRPTFHGPTSGTIFVNLSGGSCSNVGFSGEGVESFACSLVPDIFADNQRCDNGSCHGPEDPNPNWAIRANVIARVNHASPTSSLILRKPLGLDGHGGGMVFSGTGDPDYQTILRWINDGCPNN